MRHEISLADLDGEFVFEVPRLGIRVTGRGSTEVAVDAPLAVEILNPNQAFHLAFKAADDIIRLGLDESGSSFADAVRRLLPYPPAGPTALHMLARHITYGAVAFLRRQQRHGRKTRE